MNPPPNRTITGRSPLSLFVIAVVSCTAAWLTPHLPVVFAAGSSPRSYTTTFTYTENPISDKGNWINGKSVGLDWHDVASSTGLASGTQSGTTVEGESVALLTGKWAADQIVQAKVHSVNQSDAIYQEVGLLLRGTLSAHNSTGYEVKFRCSKSGTAYARILKRSGALGSIVVLKNATGAQFGVTEGDVIKATISGSVISAYINGSQVLQAIDKTFMSGSPGVTINLQGARGVNGDYGFVSFTASEFSSQQPDTTSSAMAAASTTTTAATTSSTATWKYSTNFPSTENPISEGGNWTNGQIAGMDWTNVRTTSGIAFGTDFDAVKYNDSTALLTGTWGPNQTAQGTVRNINPKNWLFEEVELRLRSKLSKNSCTGYEILYRATTDSSAYADIVRWNGPLGSFTSITGGGCPGHAGCKAGTNPSTYGVANGDVVMATVDSSNTIRAYKNGVLLMTATDSTFTTGAPGMGFDFYANNQPTGNTQLSDYGFTTFMADDGSGSSSGPTPPTNLLATPH